MKLVKYKVSIPISETDYKEIIFYTLDDVCNFFDISKSCVYKIIQGKYLFSNKNTKHLSGLKIIKEDIPDDKKEELKRKYMFKEEKLTKAVSIRKDLIEKYNEKLEKGEIIN